MSNMKDVTLSEKYKVKILGIAMEAAVLDNKRGQNAGIAIILEFGEVSDAIPLIQQNTNFTAIANSTKKMELLPMVKEIANNEGENLFVRLNASFAVRSITGKSTDLENLSRSILENIDTLNLNSSDRNEERKAYWLAMRNAHTSGAILNEKSLQGIVTLSFSDNFLIADQAVNILATFAERGNQTAIETLYNIIEKHTDKRIRTIAAKRIP